MRNHLTVVYDTSGISDRALYKIMHDSRVCYAEQGHIPKQLRDTVTHHNKNKDSILLTANLMLKEAKSTYEYMKDKGFITETIKAKQDVEKWIGISTILKDMLSN